MKKTEGRKSRWTVPLRKPTVHILYCILYNIIPSADQSELFICRTVNGTTTFNYTTSEELGFARLTSRTAKGQCLLSFHFQAHLVFLFLDDFSDLKFR